MGEDKGLPPVVLEHGCGSSALFWSLVAPEVAKVTRVIVYDRAGYGWSESGPFPRTNEQCVTELYELLQHSGMEGPYLLVGHSYGGLNVRLFAGRYPGLVAGVVLVDSMHEDEVTARFPEEHVKGQLMAVRFYRAMNLLSRTGLLKVLSALRRFPGFSAAIKPFSKQTQALLWRLSFQKKSIAAMYSEFANVQPGYEQVRELKQTDIPLTVIKSEIVNDFYPGTSEDTQRIIREKLQEVANELKHTSTNGQLIEAQGSGHNIHIEKPQIIINAIVQMLRPPH
ncbi:alpha/beta hydrolase [Paenibacillus sp. FSL H7-0350]|uniref:alpha/beta fold hydrolase n=1 Tax=Paenibacillus sp. FSL H7-0350 TaxID=2975345 RepID=UPI003157F3F5